MITTTLTPTASTPATVKTVGRVLNRLVRPLVALWRLLESRRDFALMAQMDDRMLRDIGLTRSDLRDAASAPAWADPTALLAARAAESRPVGRPQQPRGGVPRVAAPSLVPSVDHLLMPPAVLAAELSRRDR